uniref:Uncharacterized protein n=1 Tax=Oncorhynchus tshawytscha TaxID=74940 RepID=A0AAZ3QVM1_ONCTS
MGTNSLSLDQTGLAKVLFTDQSRLCLTRGEGRIRVYRRRNESYTKACTLERDRFGGGESVVVWGRGSQHHLTACSDKLNLNTVHYRVDILLPHVVPFLQAHPDMTLQHDNAGGSKSLDLKPIEHIWDLLDWRVRARAIPPQKLASATVEERDNISQQELANLVQTMRCTAVLNAAGGHTRYCYF